jgi:hypothetical protein
MFFLVSSLVLLAGSLGFLLLEAKKQVGQLEAKLSESNAKIEDRNLHIDELYQRISISIADALGKLPDIGEES